MKKEQKTILLWSAAGILFLILSIYDIFFAGQSTKSGFFLILEIIAGLSCIGNAFVHWRKCMGMKAA